MTEKEVDKRMRVLYELMVPIPEGFRERLFRCKNETQMDQICRPLIRKTPERSMPSA